MTTRIEKFNFGKYLTLTVPDGIVQSFHWDLDNGLYVTVAVDDEYDGTIDLAWFTTGSVIPDDYFLIPGMTVDYFDTELHLGMSNNYEAHTT